MHWMMLYAAIVFEVAGTTALKLSEGLARPGAFAAALALYSFSFVLLALSLKTVPVGVAYAIWSGVGTVIVAIIGFVWFGEVATALKIVLIGMIVAGAVGLNLITE
jgi:small multidrug resistance pump